MDGLRVLLAEDEALAAAVIGEALTDMGHAVVHAADGETALGLAAALPFDVLVTDLAMPRMTGLELIPRLRADHPDLPVVVMTGYLTEDGARMLAAPATGPTALLLKPFAVTQLVDALARIAPRAAAAGTA
ncbi:response regulator [Paracraurococcus lichenis]|uniref:Response regulator n=1 Tax=Paracraurococcus lichenis TaxID=3064888 RepID=A0ABT9DTZ2_9PROT|nr:response regulator [Paracraurococcus sp. LOR1-02]MDO9707378.1 response regulator [Paracraurococcus sp. LOR1-02]